MDKKQNPNTLKVCKEGPVTTNHNETALKVRKALDPNHNETALQVRKACDWPLSTNHNESVLRCK